MTMKLIPLIDADSIKYGAGFAAEEVIFEAYLKADVEYHGEPMKELMLDYSHYKTEIYKYTDALGVNRKDIFWVEKVTPEPLGNALSNAKNTINHCVKVCGGVAPKVYLSGDHNFRDDIYPIYKGQRNGRRPYWFDKIGDYLSNVWNATIIEGVEADDVLAAEQSILFPYGLDWDEWSMKEHCNTCICSIDKDMNTVPGWHYNWQKETLYWVTEWDAITWFYCQMLLGDTVDNIPGIKGAGPITVYKLFQDCTTERELYEKVLSKYVHRYGYDAEEVLKLNADLLYLRRGVNDRWKVPSQIGTELT